MISFQYTKVLQLDTSCSIPLKKRLLYLKFILYFFLYYFLVWEFMSISFYRLVLGICCVIKEVEKNGDGLKIGKLMITIIFVFFLFFFCFFNNWPLVSSFFTHFQIMFLQQLLIKRKIHHLFLENFYISLFKL